MRRWLLLLALCFVIYWPSLHGPFILDDAHTVQGNDAIHNPANFFEIWTSARYYSSSPDNWGYRPMQVAYNMLAWQIADGATWPFHVIKILLFSIVVLLFVQIWRELQPRASEKALWAAALFFLVAPAQTQVVSYIAATSTLLGGVGVGVALWQYLLYRRRGGAWRLGISAFAFFLALLSKEETIVFLGLLPLIEVFLRVQSGEPRFKARDFAIYALYVMVGVAGLALIYSMFEPTSDLARGSMGRWPYFMTQWSAYLRYLLMYFVPYDLNADNLEFGFASSFREFRAWGSLLANLLLLVTAAAFWRRFPLFLFCLLWFYCAISPASSIIVLAEPVNDHRAFLAYLGLGGLMIPVMELLLAKGRKGLIVLLILLVGMAAWSMRRNVTWASNDTLWEDTLAKNPTSVRAHNNASLNSMARQDWNRSAEILDACLKIEPRYSYCLINRALVGIARGEEALAESLFQRGIEADFTGVNGRRYYAEYLFGRGRISQALPFAEEADRNAHGKNLFVRTLLVRIHLNRGDKEKARQIWQESRKTFGRDPALMSLEPSL